MAGAELRVDLLPMEKRSRLQQERATLLRAQAVEEAARSMARVEVSRAYFGHQSAAKMVEVARDSMTQAAVPQEFVSLVVSRLDQSMAVGDQLHRCTFYPAAVREARAALGMSAKTGT